MQHKLTRSDQANGANSGGRSRSKVIALLGISFLTIAYLVILIKTYPHAPDFTAYQKAVTDGVFGRWELGSRVIGQIAHASESVTLLYVTFAILSLLALLIVSKWIVAPLSFFFLLLSVDKSLLFLGYLPRQIAAGMIFFSIYVLVSKSQWQDEIDYRAVSLATVIASLFHHSAWIAGGLVLVISVFLKAFKSQFWFGILVLTLPLLSMLIGLAYLFTDLSEVSIPTEQYFSTYIALLSRVDSSGLSWLVFLWVSTFALILMSRKEITKMNFLFSSVCLVGYAFFGIFSMRMSYFIVPFFVASLVESIELKFGGSRQSGALVVVLGVLFFGIQFI